MQTNAPFSEEPIGSPQRTLSSSKHSPARGSSAGGGAGVWNELDSAGVIVFDTSLNTASFAPGIRRIPTVLDTQGVVGNSTAAAGACTAYMKETAELVIARAEGVFSYSVDDRGGAAGIEGNKQSVGAIGRYGYISVSLLFAAPHSLQ